MEYKFILTEQEANFILSGLIKRPYEEVFELIQKLQQQASEQQQGENTAKENENL